MTIKLSFVVIIYRVMQIEISNRDENNIVTLEIKTEAGAAKDSYHKTISIVRNQVNIPGFRKGKAPTNMVINHVGEDYIKARTLTQDFLLDLLNTAVKKQALDIIAVQSIDKVELDTPESSVVMSATLELYPEVKISEYKGLNIEVELAPVDFDKQLEESLTRIQKSFVTFQEAADALIESGDQISLDFDGQYNAGTEAEPDWIAKEGMKAEDYKVTVEPGNFIDNFLEQTIGLKVGDEKEILVKFPEDYGAQDLAGKAAKFAIKIKGIFKPELPALDDELAKKNKSPKAETLEELKTKLKENLETAYAKEKELATEVALFKALREKAEFDIPEKAIEMNVRQDLMNMARQFGIPPEQMMSLMGTLPLDKNREVTKEKLANSLILTTIVKLENINPTTEELEAKWKEHLESFCKGDHKSDKHKADFLLDVAIQLGTEKANEMLLEANKITYVEKKLEAPAAEAVA